MRITLVATGFGAALGWLGAHATSLGWWTLVPWAIGGGAIGYAARRRPGVAGAAYGFVLAFVFMLSVYTGKASVLSRTPFFALLGIVGAVCGSAIALVAHWIAERGARGRPSAAVPPNGR